VARVHTVYLQAKSLIFILVFGFSTPEQVLAFIPVVNNYNLYMISSSF